MAETMAECGFVPRGRQVLIEAEPPETKAGGLDLPEVAQVQKPFGTVVKKGDAVPSDIQVGDRVLFQRFMMIDVSVIAGGAHADGRPREMILLDEKYVLGRLGPEVIR